MDPQYLLSKLRSLEEKAGYTFINKNLLLKSMLHSSFVNENSHLKLKSNERLEFLGDAVLELVISKYLILNLKKENEGVLSLKRSALVRETSLAKLAKSLRLQKYIFVGKGEKKENGYKRDSVLSDTLEAFFGAIYLDGGIDAAEKFIIKLFSPVLMNIHNVEHHYNFKNQLQEYTQSHYKMLPKYKLTNQSGPEHKKKYRVSVYFKDKYITFGVGSSIKKGEQNASRNALKLLNQKRFVL
ncbi:ribonuclease III [bacterium B13(2017)]|nr:ribonuclease III [bacterium B13(2017)]